MNPHTERRRASAVKGFAFWTLEVLVVTAFLAASIASLGGRAAIFETLNKFGVGW